MANRTVVVDLLIRTNQFTAGMKRASHDMASETTNMATKTRALQMQIGLLGVGMVAFAATAVSQWAKFDAAMARAEATGGEAAKRIKELNEAAKSDDVIRLGYNAVGASDAIYELVKAGVSATDILGGAMTGALSLAAAESMDAEEAARIMASALRQFNVAGKDSAHVADLLTAGAVKAQGSAHELGFALKQSGLVANQFGMSIEETTGTLAFFASAGLIGSDAGTSLRTMLLHLAGPSTKAARLMDEIGLEVYKANGEMVSMEELANNLQESMGKLSEQQRNQALATIFGSDATRAASLLYREGGDAVVEWTDKVNDAGFATRMAAGMMDSLNGDTKKLSSTWQRSMIEMGESADAPLRRLVQDVTDLIDWFGDLTPAIQGVIMALTGGGGLVILAVLGISQIVKAISTLQAGLIATGVISETTAAKMNRAFGKAGVAGTIALATLALVYFVEALTNIEDGGGRAVKTIEDTTAAILDLNKAATGAKVDELFQFHGEIDGINDALDALTGSGALRRANLWASSLDDFFNTSIVSSVSDSREAFENLDASLASLYAQSPEQAAEGFKNLYAQVDQTRYSTEDLMDLLPEYAAAQKNTANDAEIAAAAVGEEGEALEGLEGNLAAVTAEEVAAQKAHEAYVSAIVDSFTSFSGLDDVYQGVIDGQKEIATSAAESSESTSDSWEDFYDGVSVSADQYIAEMERQVLAQEAWAANLLGLTERAKTELPGSLQVAAQEMINELRGLGPEGAAQIQLLYDMSEPELQAVVELYQRQGLATGQEWAEAVEAAENPEVEVDTSAARAEISSFGDYLDYVARTRTATVNVDVTDGFAKIDALQTRLNNIAVGRTGNIPAPRATGGPIVGPGTGTSDSVPALLSSGEHVLTASDVQKAGGQDAVYRMRNAIQSGMLKFAGGGAVNVNGRSLDYWKSAQIDQGEIIRLQMRINSLNADLRKRGKAALKGLERQAAQWDLQEAHRELNEGYYANSLNVDAMIAREDARIEAEEEARKKAEKFASERADYTKDISRGNFSKSASGSQSGAYGAIDQARSDVLPLLSGAAATALATALDKAEQAAGSLFTQMDAVDESLKSATDQAKELQGISDRVKDNLVGGFSLDKITQSATVNPFTGEVTGGGAGGAGQGMLRSAQAYAAKVKTFAGRLKALADKGFAGVILQEVAAMGVEAGIPAADALLSLNLADTSAMNQAYQDIANFGGAAGQAVTEGFYAGGVAAADGLVAGITAQKDQVQAAIMDMAMAMQDALKKALGIASPSRKFRALMNFVGQGTVLGLDDQQGIVADASARLFSKVTVPGGGGFYGSSGSASGAAGDLTAMLSDEQVERLAVAFETGNVRNINAATAQKNRKMELTYGARGR